MIETYRELFPDAVVGYSGHDNGIAMPVAAYVLGARIVEKHFTLNRASKGTDHRFSLEPVGMRKLVRDLQRTRLALGDGTKTPYPSEADPIQKMGKKIVAAATLPAGHSCAARTSRSSRPATACRRTSSTRSSGARSATRSNEDDGLTFEHLEELRSARAGRRSLRADDER